MDSSQQQAFFTMLENYHAQVHPFPYVALVLGFVVMALLLSAYRHRARVSLVIIAFLWAWNGLVLFTYEAAALAPMLYSLQGILFPVQAVLLAHFACAKDLQDVGMDEKTGLAGYSAMFIAIFLYPIIGNITGHTYPAAPVFPEPCPLTIFTFGYLLALHKYIRPGLLVIPFLWSLMGIVAVMRLGVVGDAIEVIAGVACTAAILMKNKRTGHKNPA